MRQKLLYFIFVFVCHSAVFAQLTELYEIQDFSPQSIRQHRVREIKGYEYSASEKNAKIVLKSKQSHRLFDRQGRLIKKEFYWDYTDIGHLIKEFEYDTLGRLRTMKQYFGDTLELMEQYTYDAQDRLLKWKVNFTEGEGDFDFVKSFEYDEHNNVRLQSIQLKNDVRVDTLKNFYNEEQELILTLKYSDTTSIADSIPYLRDRQDTLWTKYYYERGIIIYRQSLIERNGQMIYRTTNFRNGKLHSINYHKYDLIGNIVENRTFHHYVQGNIQKKYSYNSKKLPVQKLVYKNKEEPESTVKFEYSYY